MESLKTFVNLWNSELRLFDRREVKKYQKSTTLCYKTRVCGKNSILLWIIIKIKTLPTFPIHFENLQ